MTNIHIFFQTISLHCVMGGGYTTLCIEYQFLVDSIPSLTFSPIVSLYVHTQFLSMQFLFRRKLLSTIYESAALYIEKAYYYLLQSVCSLE